MELCQLTIARANQIRVPLSLAEVMMRGHHVALGTVGGAVSPCWKEIADVLLTASRSAYKYRHLHVNSSFASKIICSCLSQGKIGLILHMQL